METVGSSGDVKCVRTTVLGGRTETVFAWKSAIGLGLNGHISGTTWGVSEVIVVSVRV
jgi:hypothetical protein